MLFSVMVKGGCVKGSRFDLWHWSVIICLSFNHLRAVHNKKKKKNYNNNYTCVHTSAQ